MEFRNWLSFLMDRTLLFNKLTTAFGMEPTQGQSRVLYDLSAFLLSKKPLPLYLLKGYAGTGKTSLVKALVHITPLLRMRIILMAPTGRAAKVLNKYTGLPAHTIHRRIYLHQRTADGQYRTILAENKLVNTLFVIDEASMISDYSIGYDGMNRRNLLDDLISFVAQGKNCRLLLIGDKAQLSPVGMELSPALDLELLKASYAITAASRELTEVMRQALDSGILFNATAIRNKLSAQDIQLPLFLLDGFSDIAISSPMDLEDQLYDAFSQKDYSNAVIVCRSNKKANQYNQAIRNRILGMDSEISGGDIIMAVKNNYYWLEESENTGFIANGDLLEVLRIIRFEELYGFRFAHASLRFTDDSEQIEFESVLLLDSLYADGPSLAEEYFRRLYSAIEEDYMDEKTRAKRFAMIRKNPYYNALQVKFAYALTGHKTQGGQWPTVFLDAGIYQQEQIDISYLRWLYTAVTRASDQLYLLGFIDEFFEAAQ